MLFVESDQEGRIVVAGGRWVARVVAIHEKWGSAIYSVEHDLESMPIVGGSHQPGTFQSPGNCNRSRIGEHDDEHPRIGEREHCMRTLQP
jgi:hypothetical protein